MSSCADAVVAAPPEQLCYVPCMFCNFVLGVSVPCENLFDMVTVRCGHCSNLWAVDMAAAFLSLSSSWQQCHHHHHHQQQLQHPQNFLQAPGLSNNMGDYRIDNMGSSSKYNYNSKAAMRSSLNSTVNSATEERVVNRPPEKRQRVPSAYNQFIKEEIQRIKANNPDISHREAFSTAAKNWAHFPHIHFGLMLETNNNAKLDEGTQKHMMPRTAILNN